jgi:exodeoxyribonuclease VII small subunit
MMNPEFDGLTFEAALAELEEVVGRLETNDLTLEESLTLYERGQRLARRCTLLLEDASLRVEQLTDDGEIVAREPE